MEISVKEKGDLDCIEKPIDGQIHAGVIAKHRECHKAASESGVAAAAAGTATSTAPEEEREEPAVTGATLCTSSIQKYEEKCKTRAAAAAVRPAGPAAREEEFCCSSEIEEDKVLGCDGIDIHSGTANATDDDVKYNNRKMESGSLVSAHIHCSSSSRDVKSSEVCSSSSSSSSSVRGCRRDSGSNNTVSTNMSSTSCSRSASRRAERLERRAVEECEENKIFSAFSSFSVLSSSDSDVSCGWAAREDATAKEEEDEDEEGGAGNKSEANNAADTKAHALRRGREATREIIDSEAADIALYCSTAEANTRPIPEIKCKEEEEAAEAEGTTDAAAGEAPPAKATHADNAAATAEEAAAAGEGTVAEAVATAEASAAEGKEAAAGENIEAAEAAAAAAEAAAAGGATKAAAAAAVAVQAETAAGTAEAAAAAVEPAAAGEVPESADAAAGTAAVVVAEAQEAGTASAPEETAAEAAAEAGVTEEEGALMQPDTLRGDAVLATTLQKTGEFSHRNSGPATALEERTAEAEPSLITGVLLPKRLEAARTGARTDDLLFDEAKAAPFVRKKHEKQQQEKQQQEKQQQEQQQEEQEKQEDQGQDQQQEEQRQEEQQTQQVQLKPVVGTHVHGERQKELEEAAKQHPPKEAGGVGWETVILQQPQERQVVHEHQQQIGQHNDHQQEHDEEDGLLEPASQQGEQQEKQQEVYIHRKQQEEQVRQQKLSMCVSLCSLPQSLATDADAHVTQPQEKAKQHGGKQQDEQQEQEISKGKGRWQQERGSVNIKEEGQTFQAFAVVEHDEEEEEKKKKKQHHQLQVEKEKGQQLSREEEETQECILQKNQLSSSQCGREEEQGLRGKEQKKQRQRQQQQTMMEQQSAPQEQQKREQKSEEGKEKRQEEEEQQQKVGSIYPQDRKQQQHRGCENSIQEEREIQQQRDEEEKDKVQVSSLQRGEGRQHKSMRKEDIQQSTREEEIITPQQEQHERRQGEEREDKEEEQQEEREEEQAKGGEEEEAKEREEEEAKEKEEEESKEKEEEEAKEREEEKEEEEKEEEEKEEEKQEVVYRHRWAEMESSSSDEFCFSDDSSRSKSIQQACGIGWRLHATAARTLQEQRGDHRLWGENSMEKKTPVRVSTVRAHRRENERAGRIYIKSTGSTVAGGYNYDSGSIRRNLPRSRVLGVAGAIESGPAKNSSNVTNSPHTKEWTGRIKHAITDTQEEESISTNNNSKTCKRNTWTQQKHQIYSPLDGESCGVATPTAATADIVSKDVRKTIGAAAAGDAVAGRRERISGILSEVPPGNNSSASVESIQQQQQRSEEEQRQRSEEEQRQRSEKRRQQQKCEERQQQQQRRQQTSLEQKQEHLSEQQLQQIPVQEEREECIREPCLLYRSEVTFQLLQVRPLQQEQQHVRHQIYVQAQQQRCMQQIQTHQQRRSYQNQKGGCCPFFQQQVKENMRHYGWRFIDREFSSPQQEKHVQEQHPTQQQQQQGSAENAKQEKEAATTISTTATATATTEKDADRNSKSDNIINSKCVAASDTDNIKCGEAGKEMMREDDNDGFVLVERRRKKKAFPAAATATAAAAVAGGDSGSLRSVRVAVEIRGPLMAAAGSSKKSTSNNASQILTTERKKGSTKTTGGGGGGEQQQGTIMCGRAASSDTLPTSDGGSNCSSTRRTTQWIAWLDSSSSSMRSNHDGPSSNSSSQSSINNNFRSTMIEEQQRSTSSRAKETADTSFQSCDREDTREEEEEKEEEEKEDEEKEEEEVRDNSNGKSSGGHTPVDSRGSNTDNTSVLSQQFQKEYEQGLECIACLSASVHLRIFLPWWLRACAALRAPPYNCCIFRAHVKPLWEDAANINGGHFSIRHLPSQAAPRVLFSSIATALMERSGLEQHCNGVVLCMRSHWRKHKVEVWTSSTSSAATGAVDVVLRQSLIRLLQQEPHLKKQERKEEEETCGSLAAGAGIYIGFLSHKDVLHRSQQKLSRLRTKHSGCLARGPTASNSSNSKSSMTNESSEGISSCVQGSKPLSLMWGSTCPQQQEQQRHISFDQDTHGNGEKAIVEDTVQQDGGRRKKEDDAVSPAVVPSSIRGEDSLLQQKQQEGGRAATPAVAYGNTKKYNIKEKTVVLDGTASSGSGTTPQYTAGVITDNEFPPLAASANRRLNNSARERHTSSRLSLLQQQRQNSTHSSVSSSNTTHTSSGNSNGSHGRNSSNRYNPNSSNNSGTERTNVVAGCISSNSRKTSYDCKVDRRPGDRHWLTAAKTASASRPLSAAGKNSLCNTRPSNASYTFKAIACSASMSSSSSSSSSSSTSSSCSSSEESCGSSRVVTSAPVSSSIPTSCPSARNSNSSSSKEERWSEIYDCRSSNRSSCQERSIESSRQTSECRDSNGRNVSCAMCVTEPTHETVAAAATCDSSSSSSSKASSIKKQQHLFGRSGDGEEGGIDDAATTPSSRCSTCSSSCCCHTPSQQASAMAGKQDISISFPAGCYNIPVAAADCISPVTPRLLQRRKSDTPSTTAAATLPRLLSANAPVYTGKRWYTSASTAAGRRGSAEQARWYTAAPATGARHTIPAPPPEPFVLATDELSSAAAGGEIEKRQTGSDAAPAAITTVLSSAATAAATTQWSISGTGRGGGVSKTDTGAATGWHDGRRRRSSYTHLPWGGTTAATGTCKKCCYSNTNAYNRNTCNSRACNSNTCNSSTCSGSTCNSNTCNSNTCNSSTCDRSSCSSCCFALCCCYCCYCANCKIAPGEKRRPAVTYGASRATAVCSPGCCLSTSDTAGNACVVAGAAAAEEGGTSSGHSYIDSAACCCGFPTVAAAPPPPHAQRSTTHIPGEGGSRKGRGGITGEAIADTSTICSRSNCRGNASGGYSSQNNYGFSSTRQHYYSGRYKGGGSSSMSYQQQQQYDRNRRHFQQGNGGETWCNSTERGRGGQYTGVSSSSSSSEYHNSNNNNNSQKHFYSSYSNSHKMRSSCGIQNNGSSRAQNSTGSLSQASGTGSVLSDGRRDNSTNGRINSRMSRSRCSDTRTSPACSISNSKTTSEKGTRYWEGRRRHFIDSAETREQQKWITQVVAQTDVKSLPDYFSMQLAANLGGGRAAAAAFHNASLCNTSSTWANTFSHGFSGAADPFGVHSAAAVAATSTPGVAAALLPANNGNVSAHVPDTAALVDQASGGENAFFLQHPPLQQQQNISSCGGTCFMNHRSSASTAAAGLEPGENGLASGTQQDIPQNISVPAAVGDGCSLCSFSPYTKSDLQQHQQLGAAMLLDCPAACDSVPLFLPRSHLLRQHQLQQQLLAAAAAALELSPYPELNDAATAQQILNEARRSCCAHLDSATAAAAYLLERDEEHQNDLQQRWLDWQQQQLLLQQQLQAHEAEQLQEGQQLHFSGEFHQEQQQQHADDRTAQEQEQQTKQSQQHRVDGQEQQQQQSVDVTQQQQVIPQQQQAAAPSKQQQRHGEADESSKEAKSGTKLFCFNPRATEFVPAHLQVEQRRKSIVDGSEQKQVLLKTPTAGVQVTGSAEIEAAIAQTGTAGTGSPAVEELSGTETAVKGGAEARTSAASEEGAVHVNAEGCATSPAGDVSRGITETQVLQGQGMQQSMSCHEEEAAAADSLHDEADSRSDFKERTQRSQRTTSSATSLADSSSDGTAEAPTMPSPTLIPPGEAEPQHCPSPAAGEAGVGQQQQQHQRLSPEHQEKEEHQRRQKIQVEEPIAKAPKDEETEQEKLLAKKQREAGKLHQQLQQKGRKKQHSEDLVLDMALVKQTSLQQQQAELELQGTPDSRFTGGVAAGWKPPAAENPGVNEEEEEAETCTSSNSNASKNWCPDVRFLSPRVCNTTAFLPALSGAALAAGGAQTARADFTHAPAAEKDDIPCSMPATVGAGDNVEDASERKRRV